MRYVKSSLDCGLKYVCNGKPLTITAFCDSDFAGDVEDSKSTSGFVIKLNDCTVAWKTTKQKATSTSTVEAEYIASCTASKELVWLRRLTEAILGSPLVERPVMYIDNAGARSLAHNNTAMSEKTKHIRYSYHFVRECIMEGELDLLPISTHENCADMMTKPLAKVILDRHMAAADMVKVPSPEGANLCILQRTPQRQPKHHHPKCNSCCNAGKAHN
jgi:hypothetical protein